MDTTVLHKLTYGLYMLSANDGVRDNGCIINTAVQVANNPTRISVAVAKSNLTHDMIMETAKFNLSTITEQADFSLFENFGLKSGRDFDKFAEFKDVQRSANGLLYLTKACNSFLSMNVMHSVDLGSHTMFIGTLVDGEVLSDAAPCSYAYYHANIKKNQPVAAAASGWKCKICNYVYEGDELPPDFICPWCKHGAEDFEKI